MSKIDKVYIVFDGTSHYGVWESDLEMEKMNNNVEVIDGPFDEWNDEVDNIIEERNYYTQY